MLFIEKLFLKLCNALGALAERSIFALPRLWLCVFLLTPMLIILGISFSEAAIAIPPYAPLISWAKNGILSIHISFENYLFVFSDRLYILAYLHAFILAFSTTLLCLLIAYPVCYALLHLQERTRFILLSLLIFPFWISFLVRIYAWIGLLDASGPLSLFLRFCGIIGPEESLIGTSFSVLIVMIYTYLPFMLLPLYTAMEKIDFNLVEAASDLGARTHAVFFRIIWPLTRRGALTGGVLTLIPVVGEFAIPELMGGGKVLIIGQVIWGEFFANRDWPLASALAILMLTTLIPPIMLLQRLQKKSHAPL